MPQRPLIRRAVWRLLLAFGLYALLMAPWPGLTDAYARGYQAGATWIFEARFSGAAVRLVPLEKRADRYTAGRKVWDTEVHLLNKRTRAGGRFSISSWYSGYMPSVLFLALLAATPIAWRRRGWALAFGLLLLHVWMVLQLGAAIVNEFCRAPPPAVFDLSPFWRDALTFYTNTFVKSVLPPFIVPVVVWALVAFSRADWERWSGLVGTAEPTDGGSKHGAGTARPRDHRRKSPASPGRGGRPKRP
jgi:hypothetical protein